MRYVPSAQLGRMRNRSPLQRSVTTEVYPTTGSRFSLSENRMISMSPSQKLGMERLTSVRRRATWSTHEFR